MLEFCRRGFMRTHILRTVGLPCSDGCVFTRFPFFLGTQLQDISQALTGSREFWSTTVMYTTCRPGPKHHLALWSKFRPFL